MLLDHLVEHCVFRPVAGVVPGSVSPWRFEAPAPRCKAALDDALAETQSTQRERRVRVMTENEIGKQIVDSAVQIHRELGPGLLEMVYVEQDQ